MGSGRTNVLVVLGCRKIVVGIVSEESPGIVGPRRQNQENEQTTDEFPKHRSWLQRRFGALALGHDAHRRHPCHLDHHTMRRIGCKNKAKRDGPDAGGLVRQQALVGLRRATKLTQTTWAPSVQRSDEDPPPWNRCWPITFSS